MKLYTLDVSWRDGGIAVVARNMDEARKLVLEEDSWADVDQLKEHELKSGLLVVINGRRDGLRERLSE